MGKINFESSYSESTILNPLKNFSEDPYRIEIRKDPLLGNTSVYNPSLKDKVKVFFADNDPALITEMVEQSAKKCVFCSERIEQNTPRFPAHLVPEGRIRDGEAILFPNLYPISKYHAVIILSKAHFLRLSEFTPEVLVNGYKAARKFVEAIYNRDASALFVAVNANYLFPAGASLVHPHLQMLVSHVPFSYHERLLDASRTYYKKNGSSYFLDLIEQEKKTGSRYICGRGKWHWLAAFSPTGTNEIIAIHENESDFAHLTEGDLENLSYGISKVLGLYERLGHLSFNYSILAERKGQTEGSRCLIKMICRQNLYSNYRNDDYFFQKLLNSELIINLPEDLASDLRRHF